MTLKKPTRRVKVDLIPWDYTSPEHQKRLELQRIECGWRWDEIDLWAEKQEKNVKTMYWVVLSGSDLEAQRLLEKHLKHNPKEIEPITDTASSVWKQPRTPTNRTFVPIGHAGLQFDLVRDQELSLPAEGVVWISSLYISWSLSSQGVGRATMLELERLAASEPLRAHTMVLDTMPKEFQLHDEQLLVLFDQRGKARPANLKSNEEWYKRQGYELFHREPRGYDWTSPVDGRLIIVPCVYLKKPLV